MGGKLQNFNILLWKNFQVRKKRWGMSIFVQVIIPILLYGFINSLTLEMTKGKNKNISESRKIYAAKGVDIIETMPVSTDYLFVSTIGYTPQSDDTDKLMKLVGKCVGKNTTVYQSETAMTDVIANNAEDTVGVVFKFDSTSKTFNNVLEYTLRTKPHNTYRRLQLCLDISYIEMLTNASITRESLGIKETKINPTISNESILPFDSELSLLSVITLLVFIIAYSVEMVFIAKEKTVGINALMSLNGIENWMNLLSWLVTGIIWNFFLLIPIVLMLKFSWVSESNAFMEKGNPFLIFLAFSLHIVHFLCFGYHIASYFNKPWKGVVVSILFICLISIIKLVMETIQHKRMAEYLEIVSPGFFLSKIFYAIERYERRGNGIEFTDLFSTESETVPLKESIGMIMLFSILGAALHFIMALYIHAIKPGKYGVKRHPFAWFLKKNKTGDDQISLDSDEFEQKKEFEKIPDGSLEAGVQIRRLKKIYNTGFINKSEFHALKDVSIDFYRGEITALLGHNGAGKTTIMSILSGLIDSSSGVVLINGKNVLNNHDVINNNVGLCPQVNITVPDLNVYQQVLFFAKLRSNNKTSAQIKEDVETLLSKVNLQDKKNCIPDQLSGGQKRRLCLAIALIGDANVLIFDEPTSGMDTEGKRDIWDTILAMKDDKTILISTHDMEEADILGDRIAIMHSGKLNSYGTSMFLKKLHGDGQVEVTLSLESNCDTAKILEVIGEDVKTLNQRNDSIVLAIPNSESLPETLDKLELSKKKFGITGISASIISLEQVFVKVTEEVDHKIDGMNNEIGNDSILFDKNTGFDYFMQTLWGFLCKKYAYVMRSPWSFLLRLILPCLIVLFIFLCSLISFPSKTVDLTLNKDSVSLYNKWKDSTETAFTDRRDTNFAFGDEVYITAEYKYELNKTLSVKRLCNDADNLNDEISKTINLIDNTLLKIYKNNPNFKIQASQKDIHERIPNDPRVQRFGNMIFSLIMMSSVMVTMLLLIPFYVSQPLCERKTGIKQLQDMTGASRLAYWGSMFLVDFVHYTITIILPLALLLCIDNSYDTQIFDTETIIVYLIIMLLFGLAGLSEIYIFSLFNLSEIVAKVVLISFPFIILILRGIILWSLKIDSDHMLYWILSWVIKFVPQINLPYVFYLYSVSYILPKEVNAYFLSKIDSGELQYSIVIFLISFIIFIGIIIIVEQKIIAKILGKIKMNNLITNTAETDEFVQKEKDIVNEEVEKRLTKTVEHDNENVFLAHELRKNYGKLQVVKDISFRVKSGECFGLLGINGAGKSTTFKMLTGEKTSCHGKMYLKNIGMHDNRDKYLSNMGYCPQHDALIETLNAWDHLYLFARLRGIPESRIKSSVEGWIKRLNLSACASRPSQTYSGGNKRRLNIALSLIGKPSLVLMDEPTTGVDPAARKSLWNALKYCQNSGQSIIFTSHSMEECEALCNRLVIMMNGKLVCIGAVQELKQRFSTGYNIHVKISHASSVEDIQHIKETIESTIGCQKMDENAGFLGYHVTDPDATWTVMYRMMNTLKNDYKCIEDFAVLSSTLEQLFIQFARADHTDLTSCEIP